MRKLLFLILSGILLLVLLATNGIPVHAQENSSYDLGLADNVLRVSNHLPEYRTNTILMAIAQAHSGVGSARPVDWTDRYNGFFSVGNQQTISSTVTSDATVVPKGTTGPTPVPDNIVMTTTPHADGSVIHVVESGHTLYTIAEAYSVTVQTLLDLNGLTINDRLYVGDKVIVRAANTATPTLDVTNTSTPRPPTSTRRATRTPTLQPDTSTSTPLPSVTSTPTPVSALGKDPMGNIMLGFVIILFVLGVTLIIIGAFLKRQSGTEDLPN